MRRMVLVPLAVCICLVQCALSALAATIRVPADQPTIQAAINAAANFDIVLVSPGTYTENLEYSGKSVRLVGSGGADSTILQPSDPATNTVDLSPSLVGGAELTGFTLRGGEAKHVIHVTIGGTPWIHHNILRDNLSFVANACEIGCYGANPYIERNLFIHNRSLGGIGVFSGGATILNNTFDDNSRGFWSQGSGVVAKNNIVSNSVQFGIGDDGFADVDYNCVFNNNPDYALGAVPGLHDINADPLYTSPIVGNYTIQLTSPCVDAGDPQSGDPDGTRIDMGAFPAVCPQLPDFDDCDSDGIVNVSDNCPRKYNPGQADADSDGIGDECDNCISIQNPDQQDNDRDLLDPLTK